MIYIAERQNPVDPTINSGKFSSYGNCLWMVLITIFTVGYGEMSAHTVLGRDISLFMAFTCLLIIATMINIVQNSLHLSEDEQKVIKFLQENKKI